MRAPLISTFGVLSLCLLVASAIFEREARGQTSYQKPAQTIARILDVPETPAVSFGPDSKRFLLVGKVPYPSIAELANPMLAVAGLRINPSNSGPRRLPANIGVTLRDVRGDRATEISLPAKARISLPVWSPNSRRFAYAVYKEASIELWVADARSGKTARMKGIVLNDVLGEPFQWMPDSRTLLCLTVPKNRGQPPLPPNVPIGPTIQESFGKSSPVRTYQNLLKNPHDKKLFDYYGRSQLTTIDTATGITVHAGVPAVFQRVDPLSTPCTKWSVGSI